MIALVDCDAFFCSCEQVFRPDLKETAIGVLSNNDGCVIARNRQFKQLGIPMGEPFFKARETCEKNGAVLFSSNFALYTDMSKRVMALLKTFSPRVEVYSVDECFLDLSGMDDLFNYCVEMKKKIERLTHIPVSIGVGRTKGLAKAAVYRAKREARNIGVVTLESEEQETAILNTMPISKIWGIAKGRALQLRLLGISTAKDFRDYSNEKKIQSVVTKVGRQIQEELRGIICFPITLTREKKKEVMSSRSLAAPITNYRELSETIAHHASDVAQELRVQGSVASEVLVFARSNPFKEDGRFHHISKIYRLYTPTNNTFKIIKVALRALKDSFISGVEYKKSGVRVMKLMDEAEHSLSLFGTLESEKEKTLMKAMDVINSREGRRSVHSLACGTYDLTWRMNRNYCSPRYTTSWYDIPKCK